MATPNSRRVLTRAAPPRVEFNSDFRESMEFPDVMPRPDRKRKSRSNRGWFWQLFKAFLLRKDPVSSFCESNDVPQI